MIRISLTCKVCHLNLRNQNADAHLTGQFSTTCQVDFTR
jgi:hypothetical protein